MALGGCAVPGCYKVASGVPLLDGRVRRMINQGLLLVSDATSQAVADLVVGDTAPESFLEIGAGRATKTILDQSIATGDTASRSPSTLRWTCTPSRPSCSKSAPSSTGLM